MPSNHMIYYPQFFMLFLFLNIFSIFCENKLQVLTSYAELILDFNPSAKLYSP